MEYVLILNNWVSVKHLMPLVEKVSQSIMDKSYDESLITNTAVMHSTLKQHGQQLEAIYKGLYWVCLVL